MALTDPLPIQPLHGPLDATVVVPGSKSITNRALVCAALAEGDSVLTGALEADDTIAMVEGLRALGIQIDADWPTATLRVHGCGGRPPAELAFVDARLSGTTGRFLLPLAALSHGVVRVDGANRLRERPMEDMVMALRSLGVRIDDVGAPGFLPVEVHGEAIRGGEVTVAGDASSQFVSGLLLAGPAMVAGLRVGVSSELVSRPYVQMTSAVMSAFGAHMPAPEDDPEVWTAPAGGYAGRGGEPFPIEPDASAASYAFAAAAICGGRVTVNGLGDTALQHDVELVHRLAEMGARVEIDEHHITVTGTGTLRGLPEVNMSQYSDVAQTLAVVATFADSPTRITGVGFIRGKETDRVGNVVAELRRAGIDAEVEPDGYVVHPGAARPATIETYDDHRMAMAFALLGLRHEGIRIADPGCVVKTYPGYWAMLDGLRAGAGGSPKVPAS